MQSSSISAVGPTKRDGYDSDSQDMGVVEHRVFLCPLLNLSKLISLCSMGQVMTCDHRFLAEIRIVVCSPKIHLRERSPLPRGE